MKILKRNLIDGETYLVDDEMLKWNARKKTFTMYNLFWECHTSYKKYKECFSIKAR